MRVWALKTKNLKALQKNPNDVSSGLDRAAHSYASSNIPSRNVGNSARTARRKAAANTRAVADYWPLTHYEAPDEVNTNQADEAQTTETAIDQDLPAGSDEEEESL